MYRKIIMLSAAAALLASCNPFETKEGRIKAIAKHFFDDCVTELPKYRKNSASWEIQEACSATANAEAIKQYDLEQLTGKKLYGI